MTGRQSLVIAICFIATCLAAAEEQCLKQKCSCDYKDQDDVSTTKAEILAGTIGVLGPLFLSGSAFGIYKLFNGKPPMPKSGFHRTQSDLSDDSYDEKTNKSPWKSKRSVSPSEDSSRRGSMDSYKGSLLNRRGSNGTMLSVIDQESDFDAGSLRSTSLSELIDDHPATPSGINPRIRPPPPTTKPNLYSGTIDAVNGWLN